MLAAGTFAQATYSAIWFGVAVMAPALRRELDLSLSQTGLLISASLVGSVVSLIPWGLAADRVGERLVLVAGIGACGLALMGASRTQGFWSLFALLCLAGGLGASVHSASGRAVFHWFPPAQRGLAMGIRQTAIPLSGFVVSIGLPHVVAAGGVRWGFVALGLACLCGALVGGVVLREGHVHEAAAAANGPSPFRDPRLWTLSLGSALVLAPQLCVGGFTVIYLHEEHGLSTGAAAAVLAVTQLLAVGGRIAAGRWSDLVSNRIGPLRRDRASRRDLRRPDGGSDRGAPRRAHSRAHRRGGLLDELEQSLVRSSRRARRPRTERRRDRAAADVPQHSRSRLPRTLRRARRGVFVARCVLRRRALPARGPASAATIGGVTVSERLDEIYAIAQHRAGYSAEEDAAHELVAGWMREAGLEVARDASATSSGGEVRRRVWAGSHLDSVPTAGRFDGTLGVVAAIEAARRLPDAPLRSSRSAPRRRGAMGSRRLESLPDAYLELHIEQGPVLERLGEPVGVVSAIAGQARGGQDLRGARGSRRHDADGGT